MERMAPRVNVIDRDDEVVIHAEVTNVKKEDLDISLTENTVTMKRSTRREKKEGKGDFYRCEIASSAFVRTVDLPSSGRHRKGESFV